MFDLNYYRFNAKMSSQTKELVSKSREVAISMGYDYVSTLHFFIADCEINTISSVRKFAFKDDEAFLKFCNTHIVGEILFINNTSLKLTKEA